MARLGVYWWGLVLLAVLAGCVPAAPPYRVERQMQFTPPAAGTTVYILPFHPLLAPPEIEAAIFDRFVDEFNRLAGQRRMTGVILKRQPNEADQTWLRSQYYVSGEIFAYHEDSGCCSTELTLQARLFFFQPGEEEAVVSIVVPYEIFFEHDRMTLDAALAEMSNTVAERLRDGLWREIVNE